MAGADVVVIEVDTYRAFVLAGDSLSLVLLLGPAYQGNHDGEIQENSQCEVLFNGIDPVTYPSLRLSIVVGDDGCRSIFGLNLPCASLNSGLLAHTSPPSSYPCTPLFCDLDYQKVSRYFRAIAITNKF